MLAAAGIATGAVAVTDIDWASFTQAQKLSSRSQTPATTPSGLSADPAGEPSTQRDRRFAQAPPSTNAPAPASPTPASPTPATPTPAAPTPPSPGAEPTPAPPTTASPPPAAAAPSAARASDADVVFTLVRSTIVALHQANVTGNYTVLRDMSAPRFRDRNSAAELGRIFTPIREARIDLSQAVLLDPHITKATLNDQKMLYVVGAFETKPLPVTYELLFEPVDGVWRVFGISVTPVQSIGAATAPTAQAASAPAPRPRAKKPAAKSSKPAEQ